MNAAKKIKRGNRKKITERKVVVLPPDVARAFLDYQYECRYEGEKVSFQSMVVGLLRISLKGYLKGAQ